MLSVLSCSQQIGLMLYRRRSIALDLARWLYERYVWIVPHCIYIQRSLNRFSSAKKDFIFRVVLNEMARLCHQSSLLPTFSSRWRCSVNVCSIEIEQGVLKQMLSGKGITQLNWVFPNMRSSLMTQMAPLQSHYKTSTPPSSKYFYNWCCFLHQKYITFEIYSQVTVTFC